MILGEVIGTVTSTHKLNDLIGLRIMIVQPINGKGNLNGKSFLAFDTAQSGVGDKVIVIDEGNSSRMILNNSSAPIRTLIAGIVDEVFFSKKYR